MFLFSYCLFPCSIVFWCFSLFFFRCYFTAKTQAFRMSFYYQTILHLHLLKVHSFPKHHTQSITDIDTGHKHRDEDKDVTAPEQLPTSKANSTLVTTADQRGSPHQNTTDGLKNSVLEGVQHMMGGTQHTTVQGQGHREIISQVRE